MGTVRTVLWCRIDMHKFMSAILHSVLQIQSLFFFTICILQQIAFDFHTQSTTFPGTVKIASTTTAEDCGGGGKCGKEKKFRWKGFHLATRQAQDFCRWQLWPNIYTDRPLYNNCTLACTLREDQSPLGDCILVGGWRNNTIREGGWKCKNSNRPTI